MRSFEVSEGNIDAIARPTMIFSHTGELEIPELAKAETGLPQNLPYNGAKLPVNTHPFLPHSSPVDTLVALSESASCPHVEAGDAALQARAGDLPDVRLLGANYMLYEVYQDWLHQNTEENLDGGISEDSKCQARW